MIRRYAGGVAGLNTAVSGRQWRGMYAELPAKRPCHNRRNAGGFAAGALVGILGGLIGLGGAEFRLPILVGVFRLTTLNAVIFNKAVSLVVVGFALLFRTAIIGPTVLLSHIDVVANLAIGSVVGAWLAAGRAVKLERRWLDRTIMALLVCLSAVLFYEAFAGVTGDGTPLLGQWHLRVAAGLIAGLAIGAVAGLLGVAGGELLIPTIVLLYGLDIKLAGSLSLLVSLPTLIAGLTRYVRADATTVLHSERSLWRWMAVGSIVGAGIGGMLLGIIPSDLLMGLLAVVLLLSAIKTFRHAT